jgi:hypothetical protein
MFVDDLVVTSTDIGSPALLNVAVAEETDCETDEGRDCVPSTGDMALTALSDTLLFVFG